MELGFCCCNSSSSYCVYGFNEKSDAENGGFAGTPVTVVVVVADLAAVAKEEEEKL